LTLSCPYQSIHYFQIWCFSDDYLSDNNIVLPIIEARDYELVIYEERNWFIAAISAGYETFSG